MMESLQHTPSTKSTKLLRAFLWLAGFALAGLALVHLLGRSGTARWNHYAAQLRERGQPLTFEEIESRRTNVADEQNSALVLDALFQRIDTITNDSVDPWVLVFGRRTELLDYFAGVPRYTLAPSRDFRDRFQDVLTELDALAGRPIGRVRLTYDPVPIHTLLPHIPSLRSLSRLIRLNAWVELSEGRVDAAMRDAERVFQLSGVLHEEPTIISRLVQLAIQSVGVKILENALRVGEADDARLAELIHEVERCRESATMRWALWGERASFVGMIEQLVLGNVSWPSLSLAESPSTTTQGNGLPGTRSLVPVVLIRSEQRKGTEMLSRLVDAADDPVALMSVADQLEGEMGNNLPRRHVLIRLLLPSLSRAVTLHVRSLAELDCAQTALAAERFRLNRGRMPDALTELVPDFLPRIPIDPFSGEPIRLIATESGIVIYSVSEDRKDNGGVVGRPASRHREDDVGFRLWNRESRGIHVTDEPIPPEE